MRVNERTDERVAHYLRLYSCLIQTTVHHAVDGEAESGALVARFAAFGASTTGVLSGGSPGGALHRPQSHARLR